MDEPQPNVGRYRIDVAFEKPPADIERRRIEAIAAWLMKQFKREQTEAGDGQREAE
ncbi:MAG: hypothetical protein WBD31_00070 [Rubripirellula sp.]